jgi:hypothetical protein
MIVRAAAVSGKAVQLSLILASRPILLALIQSGRQSRDVPPWGALN